MFYGISVDISPAVDTQVDNFALFFLMLYFFNK